MEDRSSSAAPRSEQFRQTCKFGALVPATNVRAYRWLWRFFIGLERKPIDRFEEGVLV